MTNNKQRFGDGCLVELKDDLASDQEGDMN